MVHVRLVWKPMVFSLVDFGVGKHLDHRCSCVHVVTVRASAAIYSVFDSVSVSNNMIMHYYIV